MQDERRSEEWALVSRAREGDLAAFEALYRQHVRRVYALCLRLSGDVGLAEELTQEAFVRAWKKLAQFRGESAFSTWLHPLAVNVALAERRSRRSHEAHTFLTDDVAAYEHRLRTPRQSGASTSNAPWPACPPARAPCSCFTTSKAIGTTRSQG